ncbi:MAG: DUF87 domain-containing protein [Planctomycetia bacterium]|nr:DUF87 domain-containing protein [Planctomycetia bacterium]
MQEFEKLGVFYLGRRWDLEAGQAEADLVLYKSNDLLTHAVCVGMTGSGKTGLCVTLLEEAAIDGIPALVIDPKGDLSNLLLTFPRLSPEEFRPWVSEDDARQKNLSLDEYAREQAELWQRGLGEWGQDAARIQRLRDAAEFALYTPGSTAGTPISILRAFEAPEPALRADSELLHERVSATVTGLLALVGIAGDPLQSREHILLATILEKSWRDSRDLDLASLIRQVQNPPVARVGIMDTESFFPEKDRGALATRLNNLLSAPGFAVWREGEPLAIDRLLFSPSGKPRVSVISISHLDDAQRMFFVSLLLNETLTWMRGQAGATSLRAILYMDEIFGYFPPVANPPSKTPLLTLLKQARAFGLGIVLATQNPVDLDYKGLSNAGTWFLGRLQTERDKMRVIEGLEGVAAAEGGAFDRARVEKILSGLAKRVFFMHNVHDDEPTVFQVRWAMSYLRGPLSRDEIKRLATAEQPGANDAPGAATASAEASKPASPTAEASGAGTSAVDEATTDMPPVLPAGVVQTFIPSTGAPPEGASLHYAPRALGIGRVHFSDTKLAIDVERTVSCLAPLDAAGGADWRQAAAIAVRQEDLPSAPAGRATFASLPAAATKPRAAAAWKKTFADALYRMQKIELWHCESLDIVSKPGEAERDFRIRLQQAARQQRDKLVAKLRQKYAQRLAVAANRVRRAQQAVDREKGEASQAKVQTVISIGSAILRTVFGGRGRSATVGRATTAARGVGRSVKQTGDVARAEETLEIRQREHDDLEAELAAEAGALSAKFDPLNERLATIAVSPRKADVTVSLVTLAWAPRWKQPDETLAPAKVDRPG